MVYFIYCIFKQINGEMGNMKILMTSFWMVVYISCFIQHIRTFMTSAVYTVCTVYKKTMDWNLYTCTLSQKKKTLETGGCLVSRTFPLEEPEFKCLAQGHNCDHYQLKDCAMWGFTFMDPIKSVSFVAFSPCLLSLIHLF